MLVEKMPPDWNCGRFAPSTTGRVHPGTLLAGLLCWLDARSSGATVVLRLEDLDRERTKPGYVEQMQRDLDWFGLEWDVRLLQSENRALHEATLEALVSQGRVFSCDCSRAEIRANGRRTPDGSYRYPGTCRSRIVSVSDWRAADRPLRLQLASETVRLDDDSGLDLSGDAEKLFGDPILRRRDGAYAYHFASVVDDGQSRVDRVVRGRDLAPSTILQVALQRAIGLATPAYRHHLLFMETAGEKLSKLHGSIDLETLRSELDAEELCGRLAALIGLVPWGTVCSPADLVSDFDWKRVCVDDVELKWDVGRGLVNVSPDIRPG